MRKVRKGSLAAKPCSKERKNEEGGIREFKRRMAKGLKFVICKYSWVREEHTKKNLKI